MDANVFIAKLKANDSAQDISDLVKVFDEYKAISGQLPLKDRAPFSLNVLCVLCRNLDKAPKWRDRIDNKALLVLSIECVRETRAMERADRVRTLACIYHLHRHVVKQTSPIPPELILKISFMPFEVEDKYLLTEYSKTYWNILVDRLSYIERLRRKISIIKLLPKFTEDVIKTIKIYDTIQFCNNLIVYLVKKLHFLFNEKHAKELNQTIAQIFSKISTKDMKPLKKLPDKDILDIYVRLNECLYVIAESASRTGFKDSPLDNIARTCISIVGHSPGLFHCLQTFYSNGFCSILTTHTHLTYNETVLKGLLVSLEITEKLGYGRAMNATYPFLSQFLRLYIEYNVTNSSKKQLNDNFNGQIQEICLKLLQLLMKRLKKCEQLVKCDNCEVKSSLHDCLRLSFLFKHCITMLSENINDIFPLLHNIITDQYEILTELKILGCVNYEKCFRKLQTDIHNTAISLNKAPYNEFSIKLFDIYLKHEMNSLTEQKNISRALYNKSICELDSKLFESALINAFLSLVFSSDGLSSEKYMSLVMDIKAKELKARSDDDDKNEALQTFTVTDACEEAIDKKMYGNIAPFLRDLKFSELLIHEFQMYAKLWPSVAPIGGVWKSLLKLCQGKCKSSDENAEAVWSLYEVIIQTPTVVRAITSDHFKMVLTELLDKLDEESLTPNLTVVYASLLFLKTEFELAEASRKYGWKSTEPIQTSDPDQVPANRTIPQEYAATKSAIQAVAILSELSPDFDTVSNTKCLQNSLHIYQVFVQLLLHFSRDMEGMQLARICCHIAECVGDKEAYVTNAGTLLYHGGSNPALQSMIAPAAAMSRGLGETAITFLCNASIYLSKRNSVGVAARLVQSAQTQILALYEGNPQINLDLAVGKLMEAQTQLCKDTGPSTLSAVNGIQRHYLAIANTGSKWHLRRHRALTVRVESGDASYRASHVSRALCLWRRARAAAGVALACRAATERAKLYAEITDPASSDDAQIKIDNRLKHFLGLQPSNETQPYYATIVSKNLEPFTPKQEVETMLENMLFKRSQTSPSIPCTSVPAFKIPDWFEHSTKCDCYACSMPACSILACQTSGLEASMYFRATENDIARNYFNGVIKMLNGTEERFKHVRRKFSEVYEEIIVQSVMEKYRDWFLRVKVEILVELSFFELSVGDYDVADEHIVEIHEILQEFQVDQYMSNEIMNLMTCSAQLRKIKKKSSDTLELEFENLRISPVKSVEQPPSTPITKAKPYKAVTKMIVRDEELPKKRKVIKLNLDEGDEKEFKEVRSRKPQFKIPEPTTWKHVLEAATPRTRSKPTLVVTQPSEEQETPVKNITVFSTPNDSTPDQFFTPMTSIKTYKKSLRHNIVKNLELEFSTPLQTMNKENDEKTTDNVKKNLESVKKSREYVKKSVKGQENVGTSQESVKKSREYVKTGLKRQENVGTNQEIVEISQESVKKTREYAKKRQESVKKSQEIVEKSQKSVCPQATSLQAPRRSKTKDMKNLKRATSPGGLSKENIAVPRCRRMRSPVTFSVDDDDGR